MAYAGPRPKTPTTTRNGASARPEKPQRPAPFAEGKLREIVDEMFRDTDYTEWAAELKADRQLIFRDKERWPEIPDIPLSVVHMSPDPELACHKYAKRAQLAPFSVIVVAQKEGDKAEQNADKCERYFRRHFELWRHVRRQVLFNQARRVGVYHLRLNAEAVPVAPAPGNSTPADYHKRVEAFLREKRDTIFALECIEPEQLAWNRAFATNPYANAAMVAQRTVVPRVDVEGRYSKTITGAGDKLEVLAPSTGDSPRDTRNRPRQVHLTILETKHWCYHLVDDGDQKHAKMVGQYPNLFGRPGYVLDPGDMTGFPEPVKRFRGLIEGMVAVVPHENVFGSLKLHQAATAGRMGTQIVPTNPDKTPEADPEIDVVDGVVTVSDGWKLENLKFDAGFDVHDAFRVARELTQQYGFPVEFDRPHEVKASAGYERALMHEALANILDEPLAMDAAAWRDIFLMMAAAVKEFPLPVTVRTVHPGERDPEMPADVMEEVSLEAADVVDMDLRVSFDSMSQATRLALTEEGLKLWKANIIGETELMTKYMGIDDVHAARRLRRRDAIRKPMEKRALDLALATADKLLAVIEPEAVAQAGVDPAVMEEAAITDDTQGPTFPTGPGRAQRLIPPEPEELGQVEMGSDVVVG